VKNLFNKLILIINILLAAGLGISSIACLVSPEKSWIPGIFGLFYPTFLFFNILLVIYWAFVRKKYILISTIIILLGFGHLQNLFSLHSSKDKDDDKKFKLITYNTRLFDIYQWSEEKNTSQKIINLLQNKNADIICIQEFVTESNGILSEKNLKNTIGNNKKAHIVYVFNSRNRGQRHGIATYTRFPIINKGKISYENSSNISIYTDMLVFEDTIRVYNNHLQSIRFKQDELDLFLNNEDDPKKSLNNIYNILRKIKSANSKRAKQAEVLRDHISNSPYPVIVCGDFNDTPFSYTYKTVKGNLTDAFNSTGKGFGSTYRKDFLSFRIDFILHDKIFDSMKFKTDKARLSDHKAVSSNFVLKRN